MEAALDAANGQRILIDHHREPQTDKFSYGVSDVNKSSTCEMVYDLIVASGHAALINNAIAQCLYAGVMTDTGSFRFPITSSGVHRMVANLIDRGLLHSPIHEALFDNSSEGRLRFIGNVLLNRMEVFYEFNAALIAIPQADLIKFDIKTGDTEGLVNYPLGIEGIKLAAIIIDRGEERKCSFRSKGEFDVNSFARKYFNGGGHYNAAGGATTDSLEKAVADFKAAMEANREQLTTYTF
jgi:phosphoesterase RecJ-like protein